jgi:uncharacterized protein YdeI (YjbR/CyaY-like superfamily)
METLLFADAAAWEAWLAANHARPEGVWLRMARKGGMPATLTNDEALDVALCYGWINGRRRSLSDAHYLQSWTRRRPRSAWSQVNVEKVAALTAVGRMRAPGLTSVAEAKADGRWEAAYAAQSSAPVPPALAAALAVSPAASAAFSALGRTDRYLMALPVLKARTEAGRAAAVARAMASLASAGR